MTVTRGRVLRAADAEKATIHHVRSAAMAPAPRRRVARVEVDAHATATRILDDAAARAAALLEDAHRRAEAESARATHEARAAERAAFAALYIALRAEDENRAERDQSRTITLAVVLAERLVGEALALEPRLIASLAKRALTEARGARRVVIEASPADILALRVHLAELGLPDAAVEVAENATLARGDLCLHTDLGTLHARITPQLERLAPALRDALRAR